MTPMHAGRQCNAMTNNDKQTKKDEVSQFKSSDHASWSESTEKDLKRHLKEKSICGGFAGLTPECLAKMKEIEKKKESFKERLWKMIDVIVAIVLFTLNVVLGLELGTVRRGGSGHWRWIGT